MPTREGDDEPTGWHYQRQLKVKSDSSAPDGKHFVTFENTDPGRGCHALQGFAVSGRAISSLDLHYWVRSKNIRPGAKADDVPRIIITFYDDRRVTVGEESVGQFDGTFAWREETARIRVPLKAREAIIRIGLLGAVGELSLDGSAAFADTCTIRSLHFLSEKGRGGSHRNWVGERIPTPVTELSLV